MNLGVEEAARLMSIKNKANPHGKKVSAQFVRIGLQQKVLPFGSAVLNPGGTYTYYISPKLFQEFTGIKLTDDYFEYTEKDIKKENTHATNNDNSL